MNIIRQFLAQQMPCIIEDLLSDEITLLCCIKHVFRSDMINVCHLTKERRLRSGSHDLFRSTRYTGGRCICLNTTLLSATAETSVTRVVHFAVTQLTGKTVMTIEQLTVNHNTRTYTGAESDDDEVLHAACGTVDHLALRCGVRIIRNGALNTHPLAD